MNIGLITNRWFRKITIFAILLSGSALLVGCASSGVEVKQQGMSTARISVENEQQLPNGDVSYTIAPLDVLQVDVYPRRSVMKQRKAEYADDIRLELYFNDKHYRMGPGDTLGIELAGESDRVYDVAVMPDGNMHLPRIGREVSAFGKTPAELTALLNREYATLLRRPQVTVSVNKSGLEQLQRLSSSYRVDSDGRIIMPLLGAFKPVGMDAAQIKAVVATKAEQYFRNKIEVEVSIFPGSSRQTVDLRSAGEGIQYFHGAVKVGPDGSVFVPDVGVFEARGKTLSSLIQEMQSAFDNVYQNEVQVRVAFQESPGMSVFIGGEIRAPGKYPYQASLTLLQLISEAGWVNDSADISRVVLLHAVDKKGYTRYQSNLTEVVDGEARLKQDIKLSPRDIVIIPKSGIANVDLWVDQYIRRVLPFNIGVSYTKTNRTLP